MAWRLFLTKILTPTLPNPNFLKTSPFSTSFLVTKIPKKLRKKHKKPDSPRTRPVQPDSARIPHFESILNRDSVFRFLTKTKEFLSKQPERVLRLDDAGKLYRELGFPRGRKVVKSIQRHPLIFDVYRHVDNKMWLGFTDFAERLLEEERSIMESMETDRVNKISGTELQNSLNIFGLWLKMMARGFLNWLIGTPL